MISLTLFIVVITGFTSWQAFNRPALFEKLLHNPFSVKHRKEYYRLLSHTLIHSDWTHLLFNMFVLWSFGQFVEIHFLQKHGISGWLLFLLMYLLAAIAATLPSMRKHSDNPNYNSVGASGAVSAVMVAAMFISPASGISFFFLPSVPAYIAVVLFFLIEHFMQRNLKTNIAHDAHIWGALFGIVFIAVAEPETIVQFLQYVKSQLF